jgi:hypothetical protein
MAEAPNQSLHLTPNSESLREQAHSRAGALAGAMTSLIYETSSMLRRLAPASGS